MPITTLEYLKSVGLENQINNPWITRKAAKDLRALGYTQRVVKTDNRCQRMWFSDKELKMTDVERLDAVLKLEEAKNRLQKGYT